MEVKIKTEFANAVIGFNNSALPLGQREDLHVLAQIALESKDHSLLNLFEELPQADSIARIKEEKLLNETAIGQDQATEEKAGTARTEKQPRGKQRGQA